MTNDRRRDRELMREALETIEQLEARLRERRHLRPEPLAIVGMGCRFPGADSPEAFWTMLRDGKDAITEVPPTRWDVDRWYDPDPDAAGKMSTRFGGFLDGVETFDAAFFGITPREAMSLDPQQRLLLETAWEALEAAGIPPDSLRNTAAGVFVGIGGVDYFCRLAARPPDAIDAYMASGNAHSAASGRLSFQLGLRGPSLSVDTACSSSLVAVHLACQSLRRRECDLALAAGVNVMLSPEVHVNHSRARMLAPDGRCKAFDAAADGFVRSEGCGVVALKRVTDALRDRNPVLAVIRGSAVNQDGRTTALTVPNGPAQSEVIRAALRDAQFEAAGVSYVETHGTGTELGDPIEASALAEVFGADRDSPLLVGSVKTNVGHTEAAAGVAGLIKVVLAIRAGEIPPQIHYQTPNPLIPQLAGDTPVLRIPTAVTAWASDGGRRVAGVSSFGFSGTNAHVVVEAPPADGIAESPRRPADAGCALAAGTDHRLLLLSARTPRALGVLAGRYRALLVTLGPGLDWGGDEDSGASRAAVADLCASAAIDRTHHSQRVALRAETPAALIDRLDAVERGTGASGVWGGQVDDEGGTAFLFTGQGAQFSGMARTLHETHEPFRDAVAACATHFDPRLPCRLTELLYGDQAATRLARTEYAQPALFTLEYAMSRVWAALGVEPDAVLGHSVGEYVAACIAGVIGLEDACRLVAERGRLMQRQAPGEMAAVMCGSDRAAALVAGHPDVAVAAINGPAHVVISGPADPIAACLGDAERAGIAVRRLEVSHAFHSAMMEPMLDEFAQVTATVSYREPALPLVSNVSGAVVGRDDVAQPGYWVDQVRQTVRFADGVQALWDQGCRWFLEMGPSATLTSLARACLAPAAGCADAPGIFVPSLRRGRSDWAVLSEAAARLHVSGRHVDWRAWYGEAHRRVLLPTYPFERKRFWIDATTAPHGTRVDHEDHYEVRWDEVDLPTAALAPDRCLWVVLADEGGTADAVARSLRARGDEVAMVLAADGWAREGERWRIDPDRADHYRRVLREAGGATPVDGVLYLWGLDSPTTEELGPEGLKRATVNGCARLVRMLAAMTDGGVEPGARLWVVTCGAVPAVAEDRTLQVAQAPLWGLGKVASLEHPTSWGGLVDLDPWSPDPAGLPALFDVSAGDQMAIRGGRLYAPRLARVPLSTGTVSLQPQATYLITGGLGALGLEVAGRLVARGARQLVLVGRRPPDDAACERIAQLAAAGVTVRTEQLNLADPPAVRAFMAGLLSPGVPLRGIVHAAGVTTSAPVCELDAAGLRVAMEAKIVGAWLLHEATRERELDFFVLFSSIASVWGSKGQGPYAAANEFLDRLAQLRTRLGLPGLSIGWGPWADRGMATAGAREWLERVGVRALAPDTALNMFESLLESPGHAVVADIDWPRFLGIFQSRRRSVLFRDLDADPAVTAVAPAAPATGDSVEALRARGPVEGHRALARLVRERIAAVMGVPPDELPAPNQGFFSSGLDSLMALELRAQLSAALGVDLGSTLAFDHPSLADLTEFLTGEIFGRGADADPVGPGTDPLEQVRRPGPEPEPAAAGTELDAEVDAAIRRLEGLGKVGGD